MGDSEMMYNSRRRKRREDGPLDLLYMALCFSLYVDSTLFWRLKDNYKPKSGEDLESFIPLGIYAGWAFMWAVIQFVVLEQKNALANKATPYVFIVLAVLMLLALPRLITVYRLKARNGVNEEQLGRLSRHVSERKERKKNER